MQLAGRCPQRLRTPSRALPPPSACRLCRLCRHCCHCVWLARSTPSRPRHSASHTCSAASAMWRCVCWQRSVFFWLSGSGCACVADVVCAAAARGAAAACMLHGRAQQLLAALSQRCNAACRSPCLLAWCAHSQAPPPCVARAALHCAPVQGYSTGDPKRRMNYLTGLSYIGLFGLAGEEAQQPRGGCKPACAALRLSTCCDSMHAMLLHAHAATPPCTGTTIKFAVDLLRSK